MALSLNGLTVNNKKYETKADFHFLDSSQFDTDNGSYQPVFDFIYPGSDRITPTDFKSILWNNSGVVGSSRVYDITNSLVICEIAGFSNTTQNITSFGAISNLPVGEAILQLQLKKDSGGVFQDVHLRSLIIYY